MVIAARQGCSQDRSDLLVRVQSALSRPERTWTSPNDGVQKIGVVVPHFLLTDVQAFVEWSRLETERLNAVIELYTKAVDRWQNEAVEAKSDLAALSAAPAPEGVVVEALREALIQADLKIRSLPATDQSDVEFIREALATREEAPAEAGALSEAMRRLAEDAENEAGLGAGMLGGARIAADIRTVLSALRAQPPAREDAQPVAWRRALSPIDGHFTYSNVGDEGWEPLYAHPAPDALRVAVEALEKAARRFKSIRDTTDDVPHRIACSEWAEEARQALAALQAEQKGGAT